MHDGAPLLIAPMIEGVVLAKKQLSAYTKGEIKYEISCEDAPELTNGLRIEGLLSAISSGSGKNDPDFLLGYTLIVPLLDLIQGGAEDWCIDQAAVSLICETIADIARPVVIYLQSNHFTSPETAIVRHLLADPSNFMETPCGVVETQDYFSVRVLPLTICDLDAPINRMREAAVKAVCRGLARLPADVGDRIVAVSLLGETHHLFANFDQGVSLRSPPLYTDYSAHSRLAFQGWLAETFCTIAAINDQTGANFTEFRQVEPPRPAPIRTDENSTDAFADWLAELDHNSAGVVGINGWADLEPGQSICLMVDGVEVGSAETGLNRMDVTDPRSERPTNWGWRIDWDYRDTPPGSHRLTLVVMEGPRRVACLGERIVTVTGSGSPLPPPPLPLPLPELEAGHGYIDYPTEDIAVRFNPLAALWHRFRHEQVRRFVAHFAGVAVAAGMARSKIFCHQLPTEMYGNWNPLATAEGESLTANDAYKPGITLYGAIACGTTMPAFASRHGWQRFGIGEHHPMMPLSIEEYRSVFNRLREAGAVYVAPYFMSVTPDRSRVPGEHRRFEIRSDNERCGSAEYHAALCALFKRT